MFLLSLAEMSRAHKSALPVFGQIADFTLTNQDGKVTTLADLTNHVWVADIIFTRCAASCPIMTGQMKSLQDALPPASEAKLVTLTTDPDYDSPAILKRYGEHYGADFNRWTFLTGTKKELAGLATDSLKLGSTPVQPARPEKRRLICLCIAPFLSSWTNRRGCAAFFKPKAKMLIGRKSNRKSLPP